MSRKRLAKIGCIAATVCLGLPAFGLCGLMAGSTLPPASRPRPSELPDSRSDYRAYDLDSPEHEWFHREYEAALEAGDSWVQKPEVVGLRLAGFPNPDGVRPDIVRVYWPRPDKAIVVVIATGLLSDSVEAMTVRVDLVQRGHVWEVEWAGGQWRCWLTRGQWFWGPSFCA